jgi:hypothetical protein
MVEDAEADGMGPRVEDEGRGSGQGGAEQEGRGERRWRYSVTA